MKKSMFVFLIVTLFAMGGLTMAQTPPAGRGGRGRGMMGPPPPMAPQPLMDFAKNLVAAINKQDAATVNKMVAPDAIYLDEDGHAPPVSRWIGNFTNADKPKTLTIKNVANNGTDDTALGAMTSDTTGWISFVYSFPETTAAGKAVTVTGTCSMVLKKAANGDWQAVLIHGALQAKIAGITG